ncbi:MAG TPA: hypothetical protein DIC23_15090, partial [Planctomycetaceae bacterium]|nr:hypothetical protein [Planctomycetaceae bacterium]
MGAQPQGGLVAITADEVSLINNGKSDWPALAGVVRLPVEPMQDIVFEDKYEFVPPHRGTWWPWV